MDQITEIRIEEIFDEENDQHYYWIYYYKNEENLSKKLWILKINQNKKKMRYWKKILSLVNLYTIVDNNLAKYLANVSEEKNIPCFGVLGNLILNFSKILNQKKWLYMMI